MLGVYLLSGLLEYRFAPDLLLILIGFLLFLQGLKREIVQDVFDCLTQQRDPESLSVDRLEADIRKAPQSRAE